MQQLLVCVDQFVDSHFLLHDVFKGMDSREGENQ